MAHSFIWGKPSGRSNNFPQKGRGPGHVTSKISGIQSNIPSKLLELVTSNLVHSFICVSPSGRSNNFPPKGRGLGHVTPKMFGTHSIKAERRANNFPPKGRGLGHVTPTIFGIQSNISSKLLELETSNLVHSYIWGKPSGTQIISPQRGVA